MSILPDIKYSVTFTALKNRDTSCRNIVQADTNILYQRRCWLLKHREFEYVGEPIPQIDKVDNADFILNYQKSILLSLVKRNLLTISQCERCLEELERGQ